MTLLAIFRHVALCAALTLPPAVLNAAAADFTLELVPGDLAVGTGAVVTLRLTDLRTGAPVSGAVIFARRMDMEPDGMETMTAPVTSLPTDDPGLYRFQTDLVMAGNWRLSVAAKVQGERDTVSTQIVIGVQP